MANELQTKLDAILEDKNTNLLPDHLKAGVTCLGVEGAFKGETPVKLFETIEEMQNDANPNEGDLALVYREEIQNATVDSRFQTATFPNTVVLDTAITDYIDVRYRAVDSSVMFDCMGQFDGSTFMMDCYTDNGSIRIQYTSSDGITYTRTILEGDSIDGDTVDFGTEIKYDRLEYWNDAIGYFIQVGGKYFEGLYEYGPVSYSTHVQCSPLSSLTFDVDGTTVSNIAYSGGTVGGPIEIATIKQIHKTIQAELNNLYDTTYSELFYNTNNELCLAVGVYSAPRYFYTTVNGSPLGFSSSQSCGPANIAFNVYKIDLEAKTHTLLTSVYGIGASKKYTPYTDIATIPILFYLGNDSDAPCIPYYWYIGTTPDVSATATIYFSNELGNYPIYKNVEYHLASTQLSLNKPDELLPGKIAYGNGGIIEGDGSITQPANTFADISAQLYSQIQIAYDNMEPKILTDDDKTVDKNIYLVPAKSDGTPLLDTSKVTNMNNMFYSCTNLTTLPLLDTSNVTTMGSMFQSCTNLTTLPLLNTSNVTNMGGMFMSCTNLTTIPSLDTSNVTSMSNMFNGCTSLITIPLLDTSKATDMSSMLVGCSSLTTVPLLDTSKATNMTIMFSGCPLLSDESLNNILAMCTNATSYTSAKTLNIIGLTPEQATKCTTLSNYSAFTAAGWTTGY